MHITWGVLGDPVIVHVLVLRRQFATIQGVSMAVLAAGVKTRNGTGWRCPSHCLWCLHLPPLPNLEWVTYVSILCFISAFAAVIVAFVHQFGYFQEESNVVKQTVSLKGQWWTSASSEHSVLAAIRRHLPYILV